MPKHLLIVESPAKAKTINRYLGKEFTVLASYGHVRDLIPKEGAVDPDNQFAMRFDLIDKNLKHVEAIAKAAKAADSIYLATDPDREGEAISWHIAEILKERSLITTKPVQRVVFTEITPNAIREAMKHPRAIADHLVDAQQARRALDYLVGFNLSPVLWRKVQRGLSAGRVQSPALRMIVEREEEIEAFQALEYWTIQADCEHPSQPFRAKLIQLDGEKFKQFTLTDGQAASDARSRIEQAANGQLKVTDVAHKERKRRPAPPFTTSTLQQEASRKLGFTTRKTMQIAQKLYEGIMIGEEGSVGLISYMRTDSVNLSQNAITDLREIISRDFGPSFLPDRPTTYVTKSKNAQEAHEAIRPTFAHRTPSSIARFLSNDEQRLYELIWKRALACQMIPATLKTASVDLAAGPQHCFRTTGTYVVVPGFLAVYEEGKDQRHDDDGDDDEGRKLPKMLVGDVIPLDKILTEQHFTHPPPRYTEAALVKALEEYGIGRPSTYASIIQTLLFRKYAELEGRSFRPTDVGRAVSKFLAGHFAKYVDYAFTANLEDELDAVSRGEEQWIPLMQRFWGPFKALVEEKKETLDKTEAGSIRVLGHDPSTSRVVSARIGRFGPMVQIGTVDDDDKPKFASLRPRQSIYSITLEEALELFKMPRALGEDKNQEVSVGIGRFGPFARRGSIYASLKNEDDPYTITFERAVQLIEEKEEIARNRIIKTFAQSEIQVLNGRFGPYITDGHFNAKVPKEIDPELLTIDDVKKYIVQTGKPVRKRVSTPKKAATKSSTVGTKAASKAAEGLIKSRSRTTKIASTSTKSIKSTANKGKTRLTKTAKK